jgi:hypothetical protein
MTGANGSHLVILAAQEAERTGGLWLIVVETLSQKILHKNRAGGVAQSEGPEFKFKYCKKK